VYDPSQNNSQPTSPNCSQSTPQPGCDAIVSVADLTNFCQTQGCVVPNWLSASQQNAHSTYANLIPQSCYANGDPTQTNPWGEIGQSLLNRVPWARGPQWDGTPGPDDSYIGGAISVNDLLGLSQQDGYQAPCLDSDEYPSTDGCIVRMRFQVPSMPCIPVGSAGCDSLSGSEALRYLSLTFWQQQVCGSNSLPYIADPDGLSVGSNDSVCATSIVSLADSALCTSTPCYATLLVNVGTLPSWLAPPGTGSTATGVGQGVSPGANSSGNYSVWKTSGGYTVLDLTQLGAYAGAYPTIYPLFVTIRNTLQSNTFNCSGSAVPFATATYTNVDGAGATLMGPYVPLVDYVDPSNTSDTGLPPQASSQQIQLANESYCGVLPPAVFPGQNAPTTSVPLDWPKQTWPTTSGGLPALNCTTATLPASLPTSTDYVELVATQFPSPVDTTGGPQNCGNASNSCTQVIEQSTQTTEVPSTSSWQPPLPVTIVGSGGFGFLPNLPQLIQSCANTANCPLRIYDDGGPGQENHPSWDNAEGASCQAYIFNWTDTSVSLVVNLQPDLQDGYQSNYENGAGSHPLAYLSPLADISPESFPAVSPASTSGCPVAARDKITITLTNPQTAGTSTPWQFPKTVEIAPKSATPK
jgi:hypothetical protein